MVVRSALQSWEHCHVDALLDVRDLVRVLEEDHASSWTTQRLVGGGGHDVAVLERRRVLSCRNEARDVSNVGHQNRTHLVCDLFELAEVDDARVGGGTAQDHGRAEDQSSLSQLIEVDQARLGVHPVGQGLEVDGGGGDLLLGRVVAVGQVPTGWQVQAHDPGVRRQQSCIHGKVRRAARIWLDIDAPCLLVQAECLQRTVLAKVLHLVDHLIAAVVAVSRLALRILVREGRTQALHDGSGSEVLRRDELDASRLPGFLLLDKVVHDRICLLQGLVA
mmetsp:Transcript_807/g.1883  ORF Transcript_807/g.1883 Transcript_807/m.1883 type:complete len:277 (-) Transcript_807:97-927(-)